jgi:hypothetical protein
MIRNFSSGILGLVLAASLAQAQDFAFKWRAGQVLSYRVEHVTSATDTANDSKAESATRMSTIKRWHVVTVDQAGVATLQLSLASLRMEVTPPSGEPLFFDSADPEKSNPEMREQLMRYVGQPLAVLRMDTKGRVLEVKESQFGPASRFESELPLTVAFPDETPRVGQAWRRDYHITVEPPKGVGEKYDASQTYSLKKIDRGVATIALTTAVPKLPAAAADQIPLLQLQPTGEIVFDMEKGLLRSARLRVDKEIKNHQGEGSSYRFQSTYSTELVEGM